VNRKQRRAAKKNEPSVVCMARPENDDSVILSTDNQGPYTLRYWCLNFLCVEIAQMRARQKEYGVVIDAAEFTKELSRICEDGSLETGISTMSNIVSDLRARGS